MLVLVSPRRPDTVIVYSLLCLTCLGPASSPQPLVPNITEARSQRLRRGGQLEQGNTASG